MGHLSAYLVSIVIFLPLLFAAIVSFLPSEEKGQIRVVALAGTLASFLVTLYLYLSFNTDGNAPEFQFQVRKEWVKSLGIGYHVGVDGIAVSLIMLTGFLGPIVVLSTFKAIDERVKEFAIAILVLQTAMYGTFAAMDLALFYVFWEAMLLPMYLLIGVWGSDNRIYAAVKFFLYTFAGSVMMLVAILYVYFKTGDPQARTFDYVAILNGIHNAEITFEARRYLFLAFALAFAVKVPMFPLHTWLPDAHVEAPAAGSIILAGVLLKMGTFGFMRYAMPFFPDASAYFRPMLATLSIIGILYGSMMSFTQKDMKKLIAYSSVAHLGFVMLGILALTVESTTGAVYQMLNHGISTGALFLLIGIIYERTHSRQIGDYGGIARVVPMFTAAFVLITLSSIGLPGTNGFVGEFLILAGTFIGPITLNPQIQLPAGFTLPETSTPWLAVFGAVGVILGAVYMLRMVQRVMFGPLRHKEMEGLRDLSAREWFTVAPLMLLAVVMGVLPQPFLSRIEPATSRYVARMVLGPIPIKELSVGAAQGHSLHASVLPVLPASAFQPRFDPTRALPADLLRRLPGGFPNELRPGNVIVQPAPPVDEHAGHGH